MKEIVYVTPAEKELLLRQWHTVDTMMAECSRSRAWAYFVLAVYKAQNVVLVNLSTGKRERAIKRHLVQRYLLLHPRGNPNWQ